MRKQLETIYQSYKILYSEEINTSNTTMPDTSKKTKPDEKKPDEKIMMTSQSKQAQWVNHCNTADSSWNGAEKWYSENVV